jgi:hypothetical protein
MASKPSIKNTLKRNCEAAGTYEPWRDQVIEKLAFILQKHEKVKKEWKADGEPFVKTEVNTKGEPYSKKDPRIDIMNQLEESALRYFNALGLTAKAADDSSKKSAGSSISDFMEKALANVGQK